jgi:DNA repair protein RecO (recombination protein O)
MQWTDTAIILSARRHGENSAILRLFSLEHGVHAGVLRAANSKNQRGIAQSGNIVSATWNARLAEQLGTFKCELLVPTAALLLQDAIKLSALVTACTIVESALPERHPYPRLYRQMLTFLDALEHDENWQKAYVELELAVLAESGFGLDLSTCAATEQTHDLVYVSPKSGRAVCAQAGRPYHDKLLPLPAFLRTGYDGAAVTTQEILAGMRLTGYFLAAWLLEPHHRKVPAARARLVQALELTETNTHIYAAEIAST